MPAPITAAAPALHTSITLAIRASSRLPVSIATWALYLAVFVPLALLGLILVPILAAARQYEDAYSPKFHRTVLQWKPRWAFLWGNLEDGIDGLRGGDIAQTWWYEKTAGASDWWRIVRWAAVRNPVGNIRFVPYLHPTIQPRRIRFIGDAQEPQRGEAGWFYIWHGIYSGLRIQTRERRFWLGWKLRPQDRNGVSTDDPRFHGCDFAIQLKRYEL